MDENIEGTFNAYYVFQFVRYLGTNDATIYKDMVYWDRIVPENTEESFQVKAFTLDGPLNCPWLMTHYPNRGFNVAVLA